MSEPIRERSAPDLERLRKQAKRMLRRARAGDPDALARLRAQLPRLRALADAELTARLRLTDVQHALAREQGHASWSALKQDVEARQPIAFQIQRYLAAMRDNDWRRAERLLARHPTIPQHSLPAACCVGDLETVRAWLERDPAAAVTPDAQGWRPLLYLCHSRQHARGADHAARVLECASLLMERGADANTYVLFDPSDPASKLPAFFYACMSDNVPVVRLLLERGANPNDGESVYHAAEHDRRACLELLLQHGADLGSRQPPWNNIPLYFLSGYRDIDANAATATAGMRWLLEHGADPNVTTLPSEETPLHRVAAFGRDVAVARLLLDHGAEPDLGRADGRTPYALAVRSGNQAVADLLRQRGAGTDGVAPVDELIGACMRADAPAARGILAQHPGLLSNLTREERTCVGFAAEHGREDAVRLMAELGFDLGWEGAWCGTPLHQAAWRGNVAMTRALLQLGAPVNVRDREFGSSPLAWAAHGSTHCRSADDEYCDVADMLLAAGSDRETSINRWGEPPEGMASRRMRKLLEARGFVPAAGMPQPPPGPG